MWPFSRRKKAAVGVQGQPVDTETEDPGAPRSVERHEDVIERVGLALAKERRGRRRLARVMGYEAELRRHLTLLQQARKE